ncbi:hypothetical protein PVL29_002429 [Vitis rotundifolia]|uniref:Uncharacterized protein n=1 Tax=Vitis rotundifolia TaxID=103349 RepID=A0AA39AHP0_VITRO|nr:hypothetical protein PVL29_002429 [Vitis rotundifolia]
MAEMLGTFSDENVDIAGHVGATSPIFTFWIFTELVCGPRSQPTLTTAVSWKILRYHLGTIPEKHSWPLNEAESGFGGLLLNLSFGNQSEIESSVLILIEIARILVMSALQPTLGFHHSPPEPPGYRGATVDIPLDGAKDTKAKERELQAIEAELKKREQLYENKKYIYKSKPYL